MIISLKDYERIYKIINTILISENKDASASCAWFSVYGADILSKHFKLDARPVAGKAAYHLGEINQTLVFGKIVENEFICTKDDFHFWVEVDGWIIDFMAPEFEKAVQKDDKSHSVPARMFQKPLSEMCNSTYDIEFSGDFYHEIDHEVTNQNLLNFSNNLTYTSLAEVCSTWYKKHPEKMMNELKVPEGL